jgi:hypothetical protein
MVMERQESGLSRHSMSYDELPVRGRNRTSDYFTQVFALEWQVFSKHAVPNPPGERQDCSK